MKRFFLLFLLFPLVTMAETPSDTTYWNYGGTTSINFSQVSLTNWSSGGQSSVAGVFLLNAKANYAKDKWSWDNTLDVGYGLLKNEGESVNKSDDRLEINSKLGYQASKHWFYSALLGFNTQFSDGYDDPDDDNIISTFMAPAYLNLALGMDYKPNDRFSLFLSPLNGKTTFVLNDSLSDAGQFGVDPGESLRWELGAMVKASLNIEVMENVSLVTNLKLFSNYIDKPQNVDVNWDLLVNMKINDWLSANLSTNLIYDDDINIDKYDDAGVLESSGPKIQFKELFGVGLSFSF